jgi:hypothetical protein
MRAIEAVAAVVLLLAVLAAPVAAQVRYKDDEGVVHEARERAWERSLPGDTMVTKSDMAAALGPDCDVDAALSPLT